MSFDNQFPIITDHDLVDSEFELILGRLKELSNPFHQLYYLEDLLQTPQFSAQRSDSSKPPKLESKLPELYGLISDLAHVIHLFSSDHLNPYLDCKLLSKAVSAKVKEVMHSDCMTEALTDDLRVKSFALDDFLLKYRDVKSDYFKYDKFSDFHRSLGSFIDYLDDHDDLNLVYAKNILYGATFTGVHVSYRHASLLDMPLKKYILEH